MRITLLFKSYGPYHLARLRALARRHDVLPLEFSAIDCDYDWRADEQKRDMNVRSLANVGDGRHARMRTLRAELERFKPDAVAIPGYSEADSLAAACLCRSLGIASILMSDTHDGTAQRSFMRTGLKRRLIAMFDAALVAGTPHADYLTAIGFDRKRIALGYDVVDNRHFAYRACIGSNAPNALPARYFCCARLVDKKNIAGLLDAFTRYRQRTSENAWDLVIAGDGPLRENLLRRISERGMTNSIHMLGARCYDDLPLLYQNAGAFVLPSLNDEWGLVVNEAMAAGLPVLVSRAAGCCHDLVRDGINGYTFAPDDGDRLSGLLQTIAHSPASVRAQMGEASRHIIQRWDLERFVDGMTEAAILARAHQNPSRAVAAHAIALALSYRSSV